MPEQMRHVAPYPQQLAAVVQDAAFFPGWTFELGDRGRHAGASGLTLTVTVQTVNALAMDQPYTVTHHFWVPPESWDTRTWARWLLDRIGDVQRHEAMEGFTIAGVRLFAPGHGGGSSPYHPA